MSTSCDYYYSATKEKMLCSSAKGITTGGMLERKPGPLACQESTQPPTSIPTESFNNHIKTKHLTSHYKDKEVTILKGFNMKPNEPGRVGSSSLEGTSLPIPTDSAHLRAHQHPQAQEVNKAQLCPVGLAKEHAIHELRPSRLSCCYFTSESQGSCGEGSLSGEAWPSQASCSQAFHCPFVSRSSSCGTSCTNWLPHGSQHLLSSVPIQ